MMAIIQRIESQLTAEDSRKLALDYIAEHPGRYIFPLAPGSKAQPLIKDNLNRASNSARQIAAWAARFPGCNWGLSPKPSKLIPMDVDTKAGKDGAATLAALEKKYGKLPDTEEVRTPTGGEHRYFIGEHVFALGAAGFGDDIDCPQYTLIPGCRTADGEYTLVSFVDIEPAPAWFENEEILGKARRKKSAPKIADVTDSAVEELDTPADIEWAIWMLQNDAEPAIEGKNGNNQTWKIAAQLRGRSISQPKANELMLEHYNQRCEPEWPVEEMERIVANAYSYAMQERVGEKSGRAEFVEPVEDFAPMGDPKVIARQAIERARASQKPTIAYDDAELPRITREVQALVIKSASKRGAKPADQVFQRTGRLVHMSRNRLKPGQTQDKSFHVADDIVIRPTDPGWFADRLERDIRFTRMGKRKGASGKSKPQAIPIPVPPLLVARTRRYQSRLGLSAAAWHDRNADAAT